MTDFSDVFYPSHCGRLTLYARDYGGDGPVVLCLHGLTRNSADFHHLATRLSPRFRVIVPDQRGRGRSDRDPDPARYALPEYVGDMGALLDHLGVGPVIPVGTSMGGLMAMVMAATTPDRSPAMVINDIGPEVATEGLDRIRSYAGRAAPVGNWAEARDQAAAINRVGYPDYGPDDWDAFARRTYREDKNGVPVPDYDPLIAQGLAPDEAANTSAVTPDLWPIWDTLASIRVLVIRGALSDIITPEIVAEMARRHPGLEAVTVPGRGHAPLLDEPEAIVAIDRFLNIR
ncbi:MAG: alpha/beta hydrolase [Sphingomonadales bacterium]